MAIVQDKSGSNPKDVPYTTYNRIVAADPNGTTTPAYAGEIVLDTTTKKLWKAMNVVNNSWVTFTNALTMSA